MVLDNRLIGCRGTAAARGWEFAGEWLDTGDAALDDAPGLRPQFMDMVRKMAAAVAHRPVICLVHNWDRFSRDTAHRTAFQRHVAGAGGFCATTFDESDEAAHAALSGCARA
ncbi:recombinase family protein [Streptomyces decoyicus]